MRCNKIGLYYLNNNVAFAPTFRRLMVVHVFSMHVFYALSKS